MRLVRLEECFRGLGVSLDNLELLDIVGGEDPRALQLCEWTSAIDHSHEAHADSEIGYLHDACMAYDTAGGVYLGPADMGLLQSVERDGGSLYRQHRQAKYQDMTSPETSDAS